MARSTLKRPVTPKQQVRGKSRSTFDSIFTLAKWQLRATWQLLSVVGVGMLLAVMMVCAIPLYTQVALSAGIGHALEQDPQDRYITVNAQSKLFSSETVAEAGQNIADIMQQSLGTMIESTPTFSVQMSVTQTATTFFNIIGADAKQAQGRITLLKGRLPAQTSGDTIEFAATAQGARDLKLTLNQVFSLPYYVTDYASFFHSQPVKELVKCELVGIIAPTSANDLFWHGETFQPEIVDSGFQSLETLPVLASNARMMSVLDQLTSPYIPKGNQQYYGTQFADVPQLYWYYDFDFSHFDINHLPALINGVNSTLSSLSNYPSFPPYVAGTTATGPLDILQSYIGRVTVAELPMTCLAFLLAGLTLFFVFLLTNVLIERQIAAIALLRSRGASVRQVFGALLVQGLGLSLLAFVAGPLLALLGVVALASLTLEQGGSIALNLFTSNDPLPVIHDLLDRAGIVVALVLAGIIFAIWRAVRGNVLVLQREAARSTYKPLWIRYKLDLLAAVIALAGFGFSLYMQLPGVLDIHARVLILPLTSLLGIVCLLIACLLFFLRFFPAFLRLSERLATRNRQVAPVLALAQMARSPRQSLRMVLLFALAVAFALFTLAFNQTQAQRLTDITNYQVGSDFTGEIPPLLQGNNFGNQMAFYRSFKGVTSVTLGTSLNMVGGAYEVTIAVDALDAHTYAQTMYWTAQDGSQPISPLMQTLQHDRAQAEQKDVVPAILDDDAAQILGIGIGQQFTLHNAQGPINFAVVGIVHLLPTLFDSSSAGEEDAIPQGGMLVDFQTFDDVEMAVSQNGVTPTDVWLRTTDDPEDLANVRAHLLKGPYALWASEDRRALLQNLATDPFSSEIQDIMLVGTLVVLLLGLGGNLLIAWWNARSRKTSFAVLRALGCAPGQVVTILLWEQGIVYGVGLLLGMLLGAVSVLTLVPTFIFSPLINTGLDIASVTADNFYLAQIVPGIQIVVQPLSVLALLAVLVIVCILALLVMSRVVLAVRLVLRVSVRVVIDPHMSQTLRLDEE